MSRYVTRVATSLSPDEAFDYMADLRNFAQWDPGVSSSELPSEGGVALNSTFEVVANGTNLVYVVVEYERPNRVVAEAVTKRLRSYDVITVDPADIGSVVTYDATLELKGIFRVFEPVMRLAFNRIGSKADAGLQRALSGTKVG